MEVMTTSVIYRCSVTCPINRHCFICKTNQPVPGDTVFLVKCPHRKHDIALLASDAKQKR